MCLNFLELCYNACHFILRPTLHKLQMQQSACLFFFFLQLYLLRFPVFGLLCLVGICVSSECVEVSVWR